MSWIAYWSNYNIGLINRAVDAYKRKYGYQKIFQAIIGMIDMDLNYILEAGCGRAEISKLFFRRSSSKILIVDRESCVFQFLKNENRINKVVADIRYLPFKNAKFDLIYNCGVMEHFEEPSLLLESFMEHTDHVIFAVPCHSLLWKVIWSLKMTPELMREYKRFLIKKMELKDRFGSRRYAFADIRKVRFLIFFPYWIIHICKLPM
jgi:2-polyprenyl-3-methyl-5-hydroxy-6-metoxy-1,4-benzoquinol methylase